jgi:hypothetical protein
MSSADLKTASCIAGHLFTAFSEGFSFAINVLNNFCMKSSSCVLIIHGSFQKFCTLYGFSLKVNLFYKIHLQTFNVIYIVLYHSGPTFVQVLYSSLDAFVFDASGYSGHLIRHFLNASEAFWAHQTLTWSQNWRNHSMGNASEALRMCLMRWPEYSDASKTKACTQEYKTCTNVGPLC